MDKKTKKIIGKSVGVTGSVVGHTVGWILKILGTLVIITITTGLILTFLFVAYVDKYIKPETVVNLDDFQLNLTSFIYCTDPETGEQKELEKLYGVENRVWAESDEIPEYLKKAAVAIEDKRFYTHDGVDWKRTFGAFYNIFMSSQSSFGGSTITQQLIKNLTEEKEVTVKRKLLEIFRALEFDRTYSKDKILTWYLNTIYLGQGCSGVKTAAEVYFAKDLSQLTLAECASMIGITNLPTRYDPYQNPEHNRERQLNILSQMLEQSLITKAEYDEAVAQKLEFKRKESKDTASKQSYFVDQVISDVVADLQEQKGVSRKMAEKMVYSGGYRIYTTVDTRIQAIMDEVFSDEKNFPVTYGADKAQAAMVIMDPYTGNIVGMVGGRGEKKLNRGLNRATQSYRQPGSAIKPVTVYAPAINYGFITPNSVMDDVPLKKSASGKPWPKNSTVSGYTGRMTIMRAVELSINTIPVHLVNNMTPQVAFDFATQNLGMSKSLVSQLDSGGATYSDIGLASMALGGLTRGVSVRDLTAAYASFTNNGLYTKPRTYTKVLDSQGNVVLDNAPQTKPAMREETAFYMNYLLQNVVKKGTGRAAAMSNISVAGKTGTTDEDKDRWFVGYTPYYTASVWFGFDDPKEINLEKSRNPALTMWKLVMDKVHKGLPARTFPQPENVVTAAYCIDSGLKPTANCRSDVRGSRVANGLYFPKDVPTESCDMHVTFRMDSTTGMLATQYCPPDSIKYMSLLKLKRAFNMPGVVIADQKYAILDYPLPEGTYPPAGGARVAGYCTTHTSYQPVETPSTEPVNPQPDGPSASPNPNAPPNTQTGSPPSEQPNQPPSAQPTSPPPPTDNPDALEEPAA